MIDESLTPFFQPRGVVVIGASREPAKLGYGMARNLALSGYTGAIHFVNPSGGELFGRPIYPDVASVPDPVDLAVILTPAPSVATVLRQCGQRGIRAAIVSSGGFRETGPAGAEMERELKAIAEEFGLRFIGPNCVGMMDLHLPCDTTFLQPPTPPAGEVAFISQSGAICGAVSDWIRGQGFGLSYLISLGNQANVNETDMLAPVAADPHTKVITLYLESVSDGRRFVEQARKVTGIKPVIVLKVGRSAAGQRAAASHTGALAGAESAFDAGFRRAGVIRAGTTEEMFQWAQTLAWCPLPKGRRVAVLTNAGGPGVTAADALEQHGLVLAELSAETQAKLKSIIPEAGSARNPVDMLAGAMPSDYTECLRIVLEDPEVDSVLVISPPPPPSSAGSVAKAMIPVIQSHDKPVVIVLMGNKLVQEGVEFLRAVQIPVFDFPEPAAAALAVLAQRAELLRELEQEPEAVAGVDHAAAAAAVKSGSPGQWLEQSAALDLLDAYGIPVLKLRLAGSADQAAALADQVGYPVVLKVASPDIAHKSDVGGVRLNLQNTDEVRQAYDEVVASAKRARPDAGIEGVHVQRMLSAGQEVIVGVVRDPQFGPLVMFGSGGVEVEGLKDVAFALAPLTAADTDRLIDGTWAGIKLKGFRHLPAADRAAVRDALIRLARLAADFPQIAEIEINPLRVMPAGQGAFAIDVRARLSNG